MGPQPFGLCFGPFRLFFDFVQTAEGYYTLPSQHWLTRALITRPGAVARKALLLCSRNTLEKPALSIVRREQSTTTAKETLAWKSRDRLSLFNSRREIATDAGLEDSLD